MFQFREFMKMWRASRARMDPMEEADLMINAMQKLSFVPNDIIGEIKKNFDQHVAQTVQSSSQERPDGQQEEGSSSILEKEGVIITQDLKDLPFKTFLIIGKTGTGKSSLCNRIIGHNYDSNIFPVSGGATSCTQTTILAMALFNRDKEKPPVNVIDTIGFDDPKNDTDVRIIAELVSKLKNKCDYVNLFGIAVNGQAPRLDGSLVAMIKIFEEMFGQPFWKQCVLLFTRVSMSEYAKKKRERLNKKSDNELATEYVEEVNNMFPNSAGGLRYLFLDACYDEELPEEVTHFEQSMEELYQMLDGAPELATSRVNENVQTENAKLRLAMDEEKKKHESQMANIQEEQRIEIQRVREEAGRRRKKKWWRR